MEYNKKSVNRQMSPNWYLHENLGPYPKNYLKLYVKEPGKKTRKYCNILFTG